MPTYRYGNKGVKIFKHGSKGNYVYRYGILVYRAAPPVWSKAALTNMTIARYSMAAAAIPNGGVVLVAGGDDISYDRLSLVEMYSSAGVRTTVNSLAEAVNGHAGYGYGDKAFFAGGWASYFTTNTANMYNSSGVRTTVAALGVSRNNLAAAEAGGYVLFAGGGDYYGPSTYVDAYNQSGTKTTVAALTSAGYPITAASCNNHAFIFSGNSNIVDIYTNTLTRNTTTLTSAGAVYATKLAQGVVCAKYTEWTNYITTSGVVTSLQTLTRSSDKAGTIGGKAVFINSSVSKIFEIYDTTGVKETAPFQLIYDANSAIVTTLGATMYIFGGYYDGDYQATVQTISYK